MAHAQQIGPGDFVGHYRTPDGKRRRIGYYDTARDAALDAVEAEHPDALWEAFAPRSEARLTETDGQRVADLLVAAIQPPERS